MVDEPASAKPQGLIAYYGLREWWINDLSPQEQSYIDQRYKPLETGNSSSLITGNVTWSSQSSVSFLTALSSWFNNKQDRPLAKKILSKAVALAKNGEGSILDHHFLYSTVAMVWYADRKVDPSATDVAVLACRKQIEIASKAAKAIRKDWEDHQLPAHQGYDQLITILRKQGNHGEADHLAEKAAQEGWAGF